MKTVDVPLSLGLVQRVDPKIAPAGILATAKNLRVRKDSRLGSRTGYTALPATTPNGTLVAFDLFEHEGRLCALGSDGADGFPTDIYENLALASSQWRPTDVAGRRVVVTPFTDVREVAGMPQMEGGVSQLDAASGGGYTCVLWQSAGGTRAFAMVVNTATDQTITTIDFSPILVGFSEALKVTFSVDAFYVVIQRTGDHQLRCFRFRPGTDAQFAVFMTIETGAGASHLDLVPVTNPSTARFAIAYTTTTPNLLIKVFDSAGAQVGGTITTGVTTAIFCQLAADQTANRIHLYTVTGTNTSQIRTYNFAGSLLVGPTSTANATSGSLCRTDASTLAVLLNDTVNGTTYQRYDIATHALQLTTSYDNVLLRSRPVAVVTPLQPDAVVFSAIVSPVLPTISAATNALLYVSSGTAKASAFMCTRDYQNALTAPFMNMQLDSTNGQLGWSAVRDPGVSSLGVPSIATVKVRSTERRQITRFAGLTYLSGAPAQVYDGRFPAELGFYEVPGIASVTPSIGVGALTVMGKYTYVVHWEYVPADSSLEQGPVSDEFTVVMGIAQITGTVSINPPSAPVTAQNIVLTDSTGTSTNITFGIATTEQQVLDRINSFYPQVDPNVPPAILATVDSSHRLVLTAAGTTIAITAGSALATLGVSITSVTATANNTNTVTVSAPHTIRVAAGDTLFGSDIVGAVYRTIWDAQTNTQRSELLRVGTVSFAPGINNYGDNDTFIDTVSDGSLLTNGSEILYTQGERGALAGTLQHDGPECCTFIATTEKRMFLAGLPRRHYYQVSLEAVQNEVMSFSSESEFFDAVHEPIKGIESLDGVKVICTDRRFYAVDEAGPDALGNGSVPRPRIIPSAGGLKDWRSLLVAPDGLYAQQTDGKLYQLPRGAGAPQWVGVDVQDELLTFPIISGAGVCRLDDVVVFACNNTEPATSARIIARSLRTGIWTEDTPPLQTSKGIEALCSFGDITAYVSGGVVYTQSLTSYADTASTVIPTQVKTNPIYPFGLGGYGTMHSVILTGEYRSAGQVDLRISYDDGVTFTSYDSFTLTALTVGQTVQRRWAIQQSEITSVVLEWTYTPSAPGEGFIFESGALLVDPQPGQLKELDPTEMA